MQAPRCHLTDTITGHMVRVAFDTGPTHGRRTGIGNAVAWATEALAACDGLGLQPYVTSARARVHAPERRLPLPAALAVRGGAWFERGDVRLHVGVEDPFVPARKAHPALCVVGLRALVRSARLEVTWSDEIPGVERCHVSDPFGNRIELIESGP